jgi:hypothetical protein
MLIIQVVAAGPVHKLGTAILLKTAGAAIRCNTARNSHSMRTPIHVSQIGWVQQPG